ncbi:MAG: TSUP family transporter [Alcaligenaceae bacterium]|nr:TSUP family transporter [Alcaligenaceae bacterium]
MDIWSDVTLWWLIGLMLVAFVAGFIDVIAGGAGLLLLPTLFVMGLPVINAQACAKVSGFVSTFLAGGVLIRKKIISLRGIKSSVLFAFIGGAVGTLLLQFIDHRVLQIMVPILLCIMGFYYLLVPMVGQQTGPEKVSKSVYHALIVLPIGFYDGFVGPGTGSLFTFSGILARGYDIVRATAHAKLLNCASNAASLMVFVFSGKVVWLFALFMLVGQTLGAYVGSLMIVNHGKRLIRPLVVLVCFSMLLVYFIKG